MKALNDINKKEILLKKFNDRDNVAFGELYRLFYKELYLYANSLFRNNINAEDIIQDVFLDIWEKSNVKFDTLNYFKAYFFVAIKNKFLMFCRKNKFIGKQTEAIIYDNNYFIAQAVEAELYSIVPQALNILPADCAESFILFIQDMNIKEIAQKLNKTESAIYKQRERTILLLQKHLSKDKILLLSLFLSLTNSTGTLIS